MKMIVEHMFFGGYPVSLHEADGHHIFRVVTPQLIGSEGVDRSIFYEHSECPKAVLFDPYIRFFEERDDMSPCLLLDVRKQPGSKALSPFFMSFLIASLTFSYLAYARFG